VLVCVPIAQSSSFHVGRNSSEILGVVCQTPTFLLSSFVGGFDSFELALSYFVRGFLFGHIASDFAAGSRCSDGICFLRSDFSCFPVCFRNLAIVIS